MQKKQVLMTALDSKLMILITMEVLKLQKRRV